jgi:iron complex outermembrane receptor protein
MMARAVFFIFLFAPLAVVSWGQQPKIDLSEASLETLMNIEVTSVAKKGQRLSQAAAAVFVITQEDIRRSGATSIPEALRMAPGIDVAQIDANKWAITSRGFNERYADKVLVLIDGRTAYTPLNSGVYWDIQDTVLEDIDRIEVVRGPGATLWGANAVNGVINIITRKAQDTQGVLVTAAGGDQERDAGAVRFGGSLRNRGFYRLFVKYIRQDASSDSAGHEAADAWNVLRGGFRTDWNLSSRDALTLQGDIYKGSEGQTVLGLISLSPPVSGAFDDRTHVSGSNLLGRWRRISSPRFDTTLQAYLEPADRSQLGFLQEYRYTLDIEFSQHYTAGPRHDLIWGADYRRAHDRTVGSLNISFDPASRTTNLYGAFLQDEITLLPNRLRITLGGKLEHNYYSGFAVQPNARALWTVHPRYAIWAAISRAAENSSRFDADIRTNGDAFVNSNGVTTLVSSFGTHHLPSENVLAYELGQRGLIGKRLAFDLAMFYNQYSNRHTHEPAAAFLESDPPPLHLVLPFITESLISGESHGIELSTTYEPAHLWKLIASYALFEVHLHAAAISQDTSTVPETEGSSPRHKFQVRSQLNLPHHFQFDQAVYYVGPLDGPQIPRYTRLDARLGWRGAESWEVSVGARNLLDPRHFEFGSGDLVEATQVGRSVYGKITCHF